MRSQVGWVNVSISVVSWITANACQLCSELCGEAFLRELKNSTHTHTHTFTLNVDHLSGGQLNTYTTTPASPRPPTTLSPRDLSLLPHVWLHNWRQNRHFRVARAGDWRPRCLKGVTLLIHDGPPHNTIMIIKSAEPTDCQIVFFKNKSNSNIMNKKCLVGDKIKRLVLQFHNHFRSSANPYPPLNLELSFMVGI